MLVYKRQVKIIIEDIFAEPVEEVTDWLDEKEGIEQFIDYSELHHYTIAKSPLMKERYVLVGHLDEALSFMKI